LAGRYLAHSAVVAVAAGIPASAGARREEVGVVAEDEVEEEGAFRAVGGRDPDPEEDEKGDGAGEKALDEADDDDDDGTEASAAEVAAAAGCSL
jgi:hypothetical protein